MTPEEIDMLLALVKHGWETGVVRGEPGSVQMTLLRVHLEDMKAKALMPRSANSLEPAK